ncbi:hypothetical protein, partial [Paracoccus rhizosphaerae]
MALVDNVPDGRRITRPTVRSRIQPTFVADRMLSPLRWKRHVEKLKPEKWRGPAPVPFRSSESDALFKGDR